MSEQENDSILIDLSKLKSSSKTAINNPFEMETDSFTVLGLPQQDTAKKLFATSALKIRLEKDNLFTRHIVLPRDKKPVNVLPSDITFHSAQIQVFGRHNSDSSLGPLKKEEKRLCNTNKQKYNIKNYEKEPPLSTEDINRILRLVTVTEKSVVRNIPTSHDCRFQIHSVFNPPVIIFYFELLYIANVLLFF